MLAGMRILYGIAQNRLNDPDGNKAQFYLGANFFRLYTQDFKNYPINELEKDSALVAFSLPLLADAAIRFDDVSQAQAGFMTRAACFMLEAMGKTSSDESIKVTAIAQLCRLGYRIEAMSSLVPIIATTAQSESFIRMSETIIEAYKQQQKTADPNRRIILKQKVKQSLAAIMQYSDRNSRVAKIIEPVMPELAH